MRAYDLILKKRNGSELTQDEIRHLIEGYVKGEVPDYQMAAFCMAVFFRGLDSRETSALTLSMAESGEKLDLSSVPGIKVDKHSTGGVGDKTTLIAVPIAASLGVPVAKMSGRGLGHTGGTVDKLESIPGFRTDLSVKEFIAAVKETGAALVGQTGNLVPADKKLYALRDVTATVDSIPLIASSIMSKKIAAGNDALVLDVKAGSGAFMKTIQEAGSLARLMLDIGNNVGIRTSAIISSADQPLGKAVGNALEVKEAIETLKGEGPEDLETLCLEVAAQMLLLGGGYTEREFALKDAKKSLMKGRALEKFRDIIERQEGDPAVVDNTDLLPSAKLQIDISADKKGYIQKIETDKIGLAAMLTGAGRSRKEDDVDYSAGVIIHRKVGDFVTEDEPIASLYCNDSLLAERAMKTIKKAYLIGREKPNPEPLIFEIIS